MLQWLPLKFQFGQFQHYNESRLDCFCLFRSGKFPLFPRTYLNYFKQVSSNPPSPSTKLLYIYMKVGQLFNSLRAFNLKFIYYKLWIFGIVWNVFNFKFARWIDYMLSIVWPILFWLVSSLWIIKRTKHNYNSGILVISCFPKIIKTFNRGLAENSEHFAIY